MSLGEQEGNNHENREHEQRLEITLSESQRDALLIAIQNEINSCENELRRVTEIGLHDRQAAEDYNTIRTLIASLESVHNLLRNSM